MDPTKRTTDTKETVLEVVDRMTDLLLSEELLTRFRESVAQRDGLVVGQQLLDELEKVQLQVLEEWSYNGNRTLADMKMAVKRYPGEDTRMRLLRLCDAEEKVLDVVQGELADKYNVPWAHPARVREMEAAQRAAMAQQAQGQGGSNPMMGGMSMPNQQQMLAMQMAVQSLQPAQQEKLQSLQMKMMSGGVPTPEEMAELQGIQQEVMMYMQTMNSVLANTQQQQQGAASPPSSQGGPSLD